MLDSSENERKRVKFVANGRISKKNNEIWQYDLIVLRLRVRLDSFLVHCVKQCGAKIEANKLYAPKPTWDHESKYYVNINYLAILWLKKTANREYKGL